LLKILYFRNMEDITNTQSNALNSIVDLFNQPISEDIDKCDFKKESTKSKERKSSAKNTNCTNICKKGLKILSGSSSLKEYK
ncbi:16655_t:CDS:1, partial [Gigaspora margarita]